MSNKLIEGQVKKYSYKIFFILYLQSYQFDGLSIRTVEDIYKTLPHPYQLIANKTSTVREINMLFNHQLTYNFTYLSEIETLTVNAIIDSYLSNKTDFKI